MHYLVSNHDEVNSSITQDVDAVGCEGNLLLDRLSGANIILAPQVSYEGGMVYGKDMKGLKERMQDYIKKLK